MRDNAILVMLAAGLLCVSISNMLVCKDVKTLRADVDALATVAEDSLDIDEGLLAQIQALEGKVNDVSPD